MDFRISFCRYLAFRLSPTETAFHTLLCRRNKSLRNFFQGNFFQSSRFVIAVSNHALLQKVCSLNLDPITGHLTQSAGFRFSSSLLRLRSLRPYRLFLFVPLVRWLIPLDGFTSTARTPYSDCYSDDMRRDTNLWLSQSFRLTLCFFVGCFSRICFHHRNSLLAPVSTRNGCLIAPCSQLRSTNFPVGTSSWFGVGR